MNVKNKDLENFHQSKSMTSTNSVLGTLFTCFKCGRDFKLRVQLRSHGKKCVAKRPPSALLERPLCDKNVFMDLLGLRVNIKSEKVEPPKCNYKLRDGIIIIIDENEEEDIDVKESEQEKTPKKMHLIVKKAKNQKMKNYSLKRLMDVDCTSVLGQLIEYKKSSLKSYINKVSIIKNYEKWCDTKCSKDMKNIITKTYLEHLKKDRGFRIAIRSSKRLTSQCFVKLSRVDELLKYQEYFKKDAKSNNSNNLLSSTQLFKSSGVQREIVIHRTEQTLKQVLPETNKIFIKYNDITSPNQKTTLNLPIQLSSDHQKNVTDEDCYVFKVDQTKQIKTNPSKFSFFCYLCYKTITEDSFDQETVKHHYSTVHKISNFSFKASETEKGQVWKLVEKNSSNNISTKITKNSFVEKVPIISSNGFLKDNFWSQNKTNLPFHSDVICID